VLDRVKEHRRAVWMMLFEKSQVLDVDDRQLTIGLGDPGSVKNFATGGKDELVRQAVIDVLGIDVHVVAVHDPSGPGGANITPAAPKPQPAAARPVPQAAAEARAEAAKVDGPLVGQARSDEPSVAVDDAVDADDPDADEHGLAGHDLVAQQLGGKVIGEIEHD
jgi:DNA polymerase-3 subunit gamma/tau